MSDDGHAVYRKQHKHPKEQIPLKPGYNPFMTLKEDHIETSFHSLDDRI